MKRKIYGVTVGTPMSPQSIKDKLKPVTSVNGAKPDRNGNVDVPGSKGNDGGYYTPVVSQVDDNTVKFSFAASTEEMAAVEDKEITLPAGKDGADGVSPRVEIGRNGKMVTVYIEDKYSGKTFTINDGADGTPGVDGKDGKDGADGVGIASINESMTVSPATGVHSKTVTVNMTDGQSFTLSVKDGENGKDGNGTAIFLWDRSVSLDVGGGRYTTTGISVPTGQTLKHGDLLLSGDGDIYLVKNPMGGSFEPVFQYSIKGTDDSGGGAQSDWDAAEGEPGHILNRPFYSESEEVQLMEDTTFSTFIQESGTRYYADLPHLIDLTDITDCTVVYNGTEYPCKIDVVGSEWRINPAVGHDFDICVLFEESKEIPGWFGSIYKTGSDSCTIAIRGKRETVHKIPEKYLPENLGGGIDVQGATPGQTIIVKAVDSEGKPTEWEAVDFPEGGSGGGAQADWNAKEGEPGHILNRPFYTAEEIKEIVPECNPITDDGMFFLMDVVDIASDVDCTVSWNGTEYSCTTGEYTEDGSTMVTLGNSSAFGGSDTGEPFAILFVPPAMVAEAGVGAMIVPLDETTELTLKITGKVIDTKKLDNKYLDLDWLPIKTPVDSEVFPETEILPDDLKSAKIDVDYLSDGDKVKVNFDGTDYECTVKSLQENAYYFGNLNLWNSNSANTGEPFLYAALLTNAYELTLADSDPHTIRVTKTVYEYNVLPSGYLSGGDTLFVNLTDLGLVDVVPEEKGTISLDTTEIFNRLKQGQQVKIRFSIVLREPDSGSENFYEVTAVLNGTAINKYGTEYYYYSDVFFEDFSTGVYFYSVSLSVFDGSIEVFNHLL